jgi:hypothetical protein
MTFRALSTVLLLAAALPAQTAKPSAGAVLAPAPDTANPTAQFSRMAQPGGVALSPDGATVAWTLRQREGTTLHLTAVADPTRARKS